MTRWLTDVLRITDIAQPAAKLLAVLECQDEADTLPEAEARLLLKVLICCCDQRHLQGIKSRLEILAGAAPGSPAAIWADMAKRRQGAT
ncbi:MAG: hypothetical protein DDT21_00337 [Syntrophomonadaceae bacterium]|nr:hypothetical protein [Bacillota bacterium]